MKESPIGSAQDTWMEKIEGVLPEGQAQCKQITPIDYSQLVMWEKHLPVSTETKGYISHYCEFSDSMAHCSHKNRHMATEEFSSSEIPDVKYKHTGIWWYKLC